jgi:hypothetical protein
MTILIIPGLAGQSTGIGSHGVICGGHGDGAFLPDMQVRAAR